LRPSLQYSARIGLICLLFTLFRTDLKTPRAVELGDEYDIVMCWGDSYDGVLDWMIGLIAHYTLTQFGTTGNYSANPFKNTSQFTVAHTLGFSAFTSRILATDLSQSQCNFKSHVKSSCQSLIPFLPLFCICKFRRLDSTTLDWCCIILQLCFYYVWSRSRSLLPATSRHAHTWHRSPLGPMAIYLFNVKTFVLFSFSFRWSSLLIKEGLVFYIYIEWCFLTIRYTTWGYFSPLSGF
jgi:hypothetical protein